MSLNEKKMKLRMLIFLFFLFLLAGRAGFLIANRQVVNFEDLSSEEMHQRIITERDFAISKAVAAGVYRCCINPPCAMCYMEANEWNNGQAGTCACDDLIAQGKEPCPQCKTGLCNANEDSACQININ